MRYSVCCLGLGLSLEGGCLVNIPGLLYWLLQVMIGNAKYQCSCVRYDLSKHNPTVIIGVSVAAAVLLVIIIIIIIIVIGRHRCQSKVVNGSY